jgi:hypothetical protein
VDCLVLSLRLFIAQLTIIAFRNETILTLYYTLVQEKLYVLLFYGKSYM